MSPLLARLASCWFCCGEDGEDAVGLAQRRVGAVDDLAEVLAAPSEAGAELVEDQPEAVADRAAAGCSGSGRGRRSCRCSRAAAGTGRPPAARPGSSGGRAAGVVPGARGWVGVQSTYFSPISDCGRIRQLASWRKSLKPESSISMTTTALPGHRVRAALEAGDLVVARDVDRLDRPDGGAGDPDLLAGDDEGAVVEVAPDQVGAAGAVGADRRQGDQQRGEQHAGDYEGDPPHGPGTVAVGHRMQGAPAGRCRWEARGRRRRATGSRTGCCRRRPAWRPARAAAEDVEVRAAEGAVVVEDGRGVLRREGAAAARDRLAGGGRRREDTDADRLRPERSGRRRRSSRRPG